MQSVKQSPLKPFAATLAAVFLAAAVSPPAAYSAETKITEFTPNNKFITNILGRKRGEPKVVDLSGEHIVRLPGGEKYEYIKLKLQLRHLESGRLEVQKAIADYKWRRDYPF